MGWISRWVEESSATGLAVVRPGEPLETNPRFLKLDPGPWRWSNGPHAKVRYATLADLVRGEAAALGSAPYVARYEKEHRVFEVRLERLGDGVAAIVTEVTQELKRQRELQRDREALLHEERMHAMGVLASGVAHDLNHVLHVIGLRVATLQSDPTLSPAKRTLDALSRVVGDAARIVARLQDLARKRRDRPGEALDLAAVLTGAVEMARTDADVQGVRIEANVPPLPLVRGSAAELAHVFGSLLLAAREQLPDGGLVRVGARLDRSRRVCVTISDSGPGMSQEDVERMFDPFAGVAGEAALGLSVAWGVMTRLGGTISARSSHGNGTIFTLGFPLAAPARSEKQLAAKREPRSRHVLLIDDEPDNLEVLRELLRIEGHEVAIAQSGPEALAIAREQGPFDIALCDVGMPKMSGWQVARELGRQSPGTQIWMLTGWANEIADSDPRRELVRGVLAKPLDLDQLRALLSEPAPLPSHEGAVL